MRTRKGLMDARSDAFLALPGGLGTLEELLEVWVARSLGMHGKPVVALDVDGLYAPLRASINPLRVRMSSTTSSSSASRSPTSTSSRAEGMTPSVKAPPSRAARATAPIADRLPPPLTSVCPRSASAVPTSAATSTYSRAMRVLDAQ
jgi:hypothetical protein